MSAAMHGEAQKATERNTSAGVGTGSLGLVTTLALLLICRCVGEKETETDMPETSGPSREQRHKAHGECHKAPRNPRAAERKH